MLRLHQLFFRQTALLFLLIFLIGAALGYVLLRQMEIATHERMLRHTLLVLEKDLQTLPPREFADRIRTLRRKTGIRTTVIAADGRVIMESDRDPEGMENHAGRPEVRQARREEWGSSVRHSHTLGVDLLYVAHRTDGRTLRLAYSLAAIKSQLLGLWFKALLFLGGVMGVLFWLSHRLHRSIDRDTGRIRSALDRLLQKDFDQVSEDVRCCLEFQEISRLIRKVAKKLAKRERQKAKYTRKLKDLTQRQSDIISAISHEFKNPVAAIMGYAQSLREARGMDPRLEARFLEKIHSNAEKISHMIDRLALAIKLENRSFQPKKSRFALPPLVESVREMLLQKYPDRHIEIECMDTELFADRDMIEHVLINLTENALKYSEEEVVIRCRADRLEVIDEGMGIEAKEIEKITRRFYRVDRLSWNNSIGVGLYIVKYILELHGSELEIESVPGRGSLFAFSLKPMAQGKVAE
ncbi:ATP-binding protein [Nitratifractor sp.]